jgi:hypothetical protein
VAAAGFVARYGTAIPVWDDYFLIPTLIGDRPLTLGWLWEQCNEHRIAVPKLILLAAEHLAGNDVRAGMFLSVACSSALAAILIGLAARLPGGIRPADALFPLLWLHLGHAGNFLWSIQFIHVLPTALGTAFLVPLAARASWPGPWTTVLAGIGLTLLPLCGGTGLMYVPGLSLWLLGAAVADVRSRRPGARLRAAGRALAVVPGLAVTVLYFRGFRKGIHPEASGGMVDAVRAGLQFLTGGVGMPVARFWPWSGALTLSLVALTLALLLWAWLRRPVERPRAWGLVAFLAVMASLAAAVGWGRGWAGALAGFQERYVTMAAPLWCWLAFSLRLYAPPALGRIAQNALFAGLCVLAWPNTQDGLDHGRQNAALARALSDDLAAGQPAYRIVRRHTPYLHPDQDVVTALLPSLRRAGLGPFRHLHDSPPFRETALPLRPTYVSLARWDDTTTTAHVTGVDPQLTFTVSPPRMVAGIRIAYAHSNAQGAPARFQLTWKRPGQAGYTDAQRYANWYMPTGEGRVTTVWVDDVVDQFRIQPDNGPCEFRIEGIVILEP